MRGKKIVLVIILIGSIFTSCQVNNLQSSREDIFNNTELESTVSNNKEDEDIISDLIPTIVDETSTMELIHKVDDDYNIYQDKYQNIVIKKDGERKVLQKSSLKYEDIQASTPSMSPNNKFMAYISPYAFELNGHVYLYDIDKEILHRIINIHKQDGDTAKKLLWVDDQRLLVIIGFGYGTISQGGNLYLYDLLTGTTKLVKEVEEKKEIIDIQKENGKIKLEIITWNEDCSDYTSTFETLAIDSVESILEKAEIYEQNGFDKNIMFRELYINGEDVDELNSINENIYVTGSEAREGVAVKVNGEINNFQLVEIEYDENSNSFIEGNTLFSERKITNQMIYIRTILPCGIPSQKIKWTDASGKEYESFIAYDGRGSEDTD